jgi:diacylglycerol kinase (ATP)
MPAAWPAGHGGIGFPEAKGDSVTLCSHMRVAAILGLGCSPRDLKPFKKAAEEDARTVRVDWQIGVPAEENGCEAVLLFGGDGTIHRHLSQLVKLELPVLVVPAGSGNDFARALGLRRMRDSLAAWRRFIAVRENVREIDLGVITPLDAADNSPANGTARYSQLCTPNYFCSVAGIGLDAEVSRRANNLPRWLRGHGGYALSLGPTIFRFDPFPMKISTASVDGGWTLRRDQRTMLAAFANSSTYGDGMRIAPRAQIDDGLIDVCAIGGMNAFKLAGLFPTVYFGRHLKVREVGYFQAARMRVETEQPFDIYADGEYVCRTPAEISVRPRALKVLIPWPRC